MKARAVLVTAGLLIMAYAAVGALADPDLKPGGVLIFLAGVLVGHDAIVMPIVLAAGAVLIRIVPQRHKRAQRGRPPAGRKNSESPAKPGADHTDR